MKKLAYTHETDNFAFNYIWVEMIHHWWVYGSNWPSPLPHPLLPKKKLSIQAIWNFSSPKLKDAKNHLAPTKIKFPFRISSLFETCIHFFYTWSFQVPPEEKHHRLKCQSSPKNPIWPMSFLYKPSEKWLNSPSQRGSGGEGCKL